MALIFLMNMQKPTFLCTEFSILLLCSKYKILEFLIGGFSVFTHRFALSGHVNTLPSCFSVSSSFF